MIWYDTETVGFHGVASLIQYQEDDGPITLHYPWLRPPRETLELIERFMLCDGLVGFNLAFDHFHLTKLYTLFRLLDQSKLPIDQLEGIEELEMQARYGPCIKPKRVLDLMLYARKGPYQSLMDRKDIYIRRIPTVMAELLAEHLEQTVKIDDIYFARRKDGKKWHVVDTVKPDFKDVVLKFAPAGGLKFLASHILGKETVTFDNLSGLVMPEEIGYAPYAKAVPLERSWIGYLRSHIRYWTSNQQAIQYANDDIKYTRAIHEHFIANHEGCEPPTFNDNDSTLACLVASVRWRGYSVDLPKLETLKQRAIKVSKSAPTAPRAVMKELKQFLKKEEQIVLRDVHTGKETTDKKLLDSLTKWENHPIKDVAQTIINARAAAKEAELCEKLLEARRFHASFVVIGTLSSRMAGSDGLNPQGIKKATYFREAFTLADEGYSLCGGDFDAFEVVLAEAKYNDPDLRRDLLAGKKIHALFAADLFDMTYEAVMASSGQEPDYYWKGKQGVFSQIYGGDDGTLVRKLGVDPERAKEGTLRFQKRYKGVGAARQGIADSFCTMRQPGGIGTRVEWHDPKDYIESLFGFRRYFTLENQICKVLFNLANNLPPSWRNVNIKVTRRDRVQTASGAVCSALYGAAFGIQSAVMRAAANHEIQCSGSQVTKDVQCAIWTHQPCGVHEFVVIPMNIHDEVNACVKHGHEEAVKATVDAKVESYRPIIPLIKMDWQIGMKSWAEK